MNGRFHAKITDHTDCQHIISRPNPRGNIHLPGHKVAMMIAGLLTIDVKLRLVTDHAEIKNYPSPGQFFRG